MILFFIVPPSLPSLIHPFPLGHTSNIPARSRRPCTYSLLAVMQIGKPPTAACTPAASCSDVPLAVSTDMSTPAPDFFVPDCSDPSQSSTRTLPTQIWNSPQHRRILRRRFTHICAVRETKPAVGFASRRLFLTAGTGLCRPLRPFHLVRRKCYA